MISPPNLYSPLTKEKNRPVRTRTEPSLIPYITQREGEEAAPDNLIIVRHASGPRLYYADEDAQGRDRPIRGVLWGRCTFNPRDEHKMPTGKPHWTLVHPYRQMLTMQAMRCQVCTQPARTGLGYPFFLPRDVDPCRATVLTNQPPVCKKHLRAAAELCPHVEPVVHLAQSAPLYGVHGTLYGLNADNKVHVVAKPDHALPFGHPDLPTLLASQLVRRLSSFRTVDLDELLRELATLYI